MERGVVVSHETIRQWCQKFGQTYANGLRRRRPRPGDKWHLDEVFIKINGKTHYLWRAVDQDGVVVDILVTSRRDAKAATRFFRKLLTGLQYVPRVLVTDKLGSYAAAHRRMLRSVEHRQSKYLNKSGGELPPAHQAAGTRDETIPIPPGSPTFSVRVQRDITALPTPPPAARRGLPPRNDLPLHHLERNRRLSHGKLTHRRAGLPRTPRHPLHARPPTS
jgi:DDE domain